MSDQEKIPEELKPIEAELAALKPRQDRFDPQWRAFLAKAADLNAGSPDAAAERPACSTLGEHLFLCAYCGAADPSRVSKLRRWAWPAAFSAMTAAAAVLLALLAVRPDFSSDRTAANVQAVGKTDAAPVASPRPREDAALGLAWNSSRGPRWRMERLCQLAVANPQWFDQALDEYSQRQQNQGSAVAANQTPSQVVPTAHELLNEMLKRSN